MDTSLVIPTFVAGLLAFLAPCTLPILSAYLAFISGVSLDELRDPLKAAIARRKIFFNGLVFVVGFSAVFIAMGTLVGFLGAAFGEYRIWLSRLGGIFVIIFGLFMLGVLKIPALAAERALAIPQIFERGRPMNSFILGATFAFGWTPCVGPILGSVLFLAATSETALQGAFFLLIFSTGLAVPFLLIAAGIGSATRYIENFSKYLSAVSVVGGILLIFIGALLLTDNMALLVSYGYRLFEFINYDALLDYL